jgi:hypothetical protein
VRFSRLSASRRAAIDLLFDERLHLVRLDGNGESTDSMHSRAGGRFHGITGACATPQGVVIASRGAGRLLLAPGDF